MADDPAPRMIVIAGPPGSGKSTIFPVASFGLDFFNADDRAAQLNGGSYLHIPIEVRTRVNREFEEFVSQRIASRTSLAFETTLRSSITFDQAQEARAKGFSVEMRYVALTNLELHLARVNIRADQGGHSAPASVLRAIYESSMVNLRRAILELDLVRVYDNSLYGGPPVLMLETRNGTVIYRRTLIPGWLMTALK